MPIRRSARACAYCRKSKGEPQVLSGSSADRLCSHSGAVLLQLVVMDQSYGHAEGVGNLASTACLKGFRNQNSGQRTLGVKEMMDCRCETSRRAFQALRDSC